jgi:hypothetical protein
MRKLLIVALATVLIVGLAGCRKKKVDLTFTNVSERTVDVQLSGPGEGVGVIGTLTETGSRLQTRLVVQRADLPAHYGWTAGPFDGRFTVTRHTPKKMYIDVGRAEE